MATNWELAINIKAKDISCTEVDSILANYVLHCYKGAGHNPNFELVGIDILSKVKEEHLQGN